MAAPSVAFPRSASSRLAGVSAGRLIAAAGVMLIHTAHDISFTLFDHAPLTSSPDEFAIGWGSVIEQLARFAVPFFFIASGYFAFRYQNQAFSAIMFRQTKRILLPFLVFSALYNLTSPDRVAWFTAPGYIARWLLNGGAGYHLWFLPSLFLWVPAALQLKRWLNWRGMAIVSALLYLAGLLCAAYQPLVTHVPHPLLMRFARNGPSFGFPLIVVGMWLNATKIRLRAWQAWALCLAGLAIQLLEAYWLNHYRLTPFYKPDFLLGTIIYGAGAFLLALQWRADGWIGRHLAALGEHAFGIYAVHLWFLQLIALKMLPATVVGRLEIAALSLVLASLVTMAAVGTGKIFGDNLLLSRQGQ